MSWVHRIGSLFALLALSIPAVAGAQDVAGGGAQTLLGGGVSHGGFAAVHLRAGDVIDERSLFMGGEAAWVANQRLILGVGVWALVSENARMVASSGDVAESAPLRMGCRCTRGLPNCAGRDRAPHGEHADRCRRDFD
jgi:hypothetical protein